MQVSAEISARSHQLVDSCGLDSLSVFLSSRKASDTSLTYLYHRGVSLDAQHAYRDGLVFEDDPFPAVPAPSDRCGQLVRWEDARLDRLAGRCTKYRQFINSHAIDVVGAWVQQVLPGVHLVIGAHCRPGGHRRSRVPVDLLAHEAGAIAQLVTSSLLDDALAGPQCGGLLWSITGRSHGAAPMPSHDLTPRELQIAQLVGVGNQNKQVAFAVGISEFTVENHLRRIYRKLGVHNRAAMTAKLFANQTCQ